MKHFKSLSRYNLSAIIFTSFVVLSSNATELKAPVKEFYMKYKTNDKTHFLDYAELKINSRNSRFSIEGASSIQGDINTIKIRYLGGTPFEGVFNTAKRNVVFILGGDEGTSSTLDIAKTSYGTGTFSISEITDTYAKGKFSFVTFTGEDGESIKKYDVTDGLFKARIKKY